MNHFPEQLKRSESVEVNDFFDEAYNKLFMNIANITQNKAGKSLSQELGIDKIILLKSGKIIKIDEKVREKDYGDMLIEFKSNSNANIDNGWINKNLHIDYIAYGIIPTKRVYLIEWEALKRVWYFYGEQWKKDYKIIKAKNNGYYTLSVVVPFKELFLKMYSHIIIDI